MAEAYLTAPDLSVTVTDSDMARAFDMFHVFGWEEIESGLPAGATDTSGAPLDRNNRNIRLVAMAECIGVAKGEPFGTGYDRMDTNQHWRTLVSAALDAYDKTEGGRDE